jgi:hypothetical protein
MGVLGDVAQAGHDPVVLPLTRLELSHLIC